VNAKARIGITSDLFDQDGKLKIPGPGLKLLDEMPDVEYEIFPEFLPEVTPEQIRDADMVISAGTKWTTSSLVGNERLLAVLYTGVGYDHIDVQALNGAGMMLCTAPAAVRRPMAVAIITFMLTLAMRLLDKDKITREGRWADREHYHGEGLPGKTLGSIGIGNIGHEMFRLAKPFGMRHIACDPYVTPDSVADVDVQLTDMDTVLAESDFLNISVPLSERTRHLIGEAELKKVRKTAYLINTARGPVIDEAALIKALREGWLRGAGLDVFEQEPTPTDNPLLKMDNVILAPHSLGHTDEFFRESWSQKLRQASQIIHGEIPEALLNREVLDKPEFQAKWQKFHAPR
jgi:D-3-phosphoglycerate dehydrogenase|tara:strand:- start:903 stop:1943 length:1041 start_codon:yes stop_codon:yes gene_type:complete